MCRRSLLLPKQFGHGRYNGRVLNWCQLCGVLLMILVVGQFLFSKRNDNYFQNAQLFLLGGQEEQEQENDPAEKAHHQHHGNNNNNNNEATNEWGLDGASHRRRATRNNANAYSGGGIMTGKYDVCIAGAGLSGGVLAERYASQLGAKVLVVEQRNHIAGNCYDYIDVRIQ